MNGASPHLTAELAELLDSNKLGTLATVGKDGLPLRERVKAKDVERRGWDEALAEAGRVLIEITVERVSAVMYV